MVFFSSSPNRYIERISLMPQIWNIFRWVDGRRIKRGCFALKWRSGYFGRWPIRVSSEKRVKSRKIDITRVQIETRVQPIVSFEREFYAAFFTANRVWISLSVCEIYSSKAQGRIDVSQNKSISHANKRFPAVRTCVTLKRKIFPEKY